MARPHVVLDTLPLLTLEPLSPTCLVCGKAAYIAYHTQRTVITLTGRHCLHAGSCADVLSQRVHAIISRIGQKRKEHGRYHMGYMD